MLTLIILTITSQINLADLGSEDFQVRDAETARIERMGFAAISEIRKNLDHKDPEVRLRLSKLNQTIINFNYHPVFIWSLPKEYCFEDGLDIRLIYYNKARELYNLKAYIDYIDESDFYNKEVGRIAAKLYFDDLINVSYDNRPFCFLLSKKMAELEDRYYDILSISHMEVNLAGIPEPIEDLFQKALEYYYFTTENSPYPEE